MNIINTEFRRPSQLEALGGTFTPEEDITGTEPDGRTYQIAAKGVAIPMAQAVELGLVKVNVQVEPTERKPSGGPSEKKGGRKPKPGEPELVLLNNGEQEPPADEVPPSE